MNLKCPQCGTEDTRKLSLVMSQGGVAEKGAQLGAAYGANIVIPMMTFFIAILMGIMFAIFNIFLGIIAFGATIFAGMKVRAYLKSKTKSKYADLSPEMKADGFLCNRCEHMFIPARGASA